MRRGALCYRTWEKGWGEFRVFVYPTSSSCLTVTNQRLIDRLIEPIAYIRMVASFTLDRSLSSPLISYPLLSSNTTKHHRIDYYRRVARYYHSIHHVQCLITQYVKSVIQKQHIVQYMDLNNFHNITNDAIVISNKHHQARSSRKSPPKHKQKCRKTFQSSGKRSYQTQQGGTESQHWT